MMKRSLSAYPLAFDGRSYPGKEELPEPLDSPKLYEEYAFGEYVVYVERLSPHHCSAIVTPQDTMSFFGVYDGHGGDYCADYLCDNLHLNFYNENELISVLAPYMSFFSRRLLLYIL